MPYNPSLSSRAIVGRLYKAIEASYAASWAARLAAMMTSNQEVETYALTGQVPSLREWGTGRLAKDFRTFQYALANKIYEATLRIPIDDLRRDKTGQIGMRIADLAKRPAQHWEALLSALLLANSNCYDGQAFFSATHSEGDSGTQLNLLTKTQVAALQIAVAGKPTQVECANALHGVIAYMMGWKDDQGEPINGTAREFLVMAGTPEMFAPLSIACTATTLLGAGNTQVPNPVLAQGFKFTPVLNPRLSSWTASFGVFRTDDTVKPFICQEEEALKVDAISDGSEMEINERVHQYSVTAIRAAGYGWWSTAAKATVAT